MPSSLIVCILYDIDISQYNLSCMMQPSYTFTNKYVKIDRLYCILIIENVVVGVYIFMMDYVTSAVRLSLSSSYTYYIAFFLDFNLANSATMLSKLILLVKYASMPTMVKRDKSLSLSWPSVELL